MAKTAKIICRSIFRESKPDLEQLEDILYSAPDETETAEETLPDDFI